MLRLALLYTHKARVVREQAEAEILRCHEKSLPLRQRTEAQLSAEQDVWYEAALRLLQLLPPSAAVHLSRARLLLLRDQIREQQADEDDAGVEVPRRHARQLEDLHQ